MFAAVSAVLAAMAFIFGLSLRESGWLESLSYFGSSFAFILFAVVQWLSRRRVRRSLKNRISELVLRFIVLVSGVSASLIAGSVLILVFDVAGPLLVLCLILGTFAAIGFAYFVSYLRAEHRTDFQPAPINESLPLLLANAEHARHTHVHCSIPDQSSTRARIEKARRRIRSLAYFLTGVQDDKSGAS